jgi:predicted phage terminase large subunit-like protein
LFAAEASLSSYVQQAWHLVEPKKGLVWNWHMDIICRHLEAVTNSYIIRSGSDKKGEPDIPPINYLWINVPPRHTKSLLVNVFWPTWEWGPMGLSELQYIFSSYAAELSTRDSLKRRRIIQSAWYQERWGDRFHFVGDQNRKTRFENNKTGYMISTSVGGVGTGEGGDRIIVDDAHNVQGVESEVKREAVLGWWDDTMSSRLNDEKTGAYIGIMQRTHQLDLSGHVFEKAQNGEIDLTYVCLPARYEKKHPFPSQSPLEIEDPRTNEGESLDKGRYDDDQLSALEKRMTAWSRASQLQQRPTVRGGQIFKVENIKVIEPQDFFFNRVLRQIRYWDKAGTEDGGKRTAGVKLASVRDCTYDFIVLDVVKGQWEAGPRESRMKQVAQTDGREVQIWIEQEGGSGGKESAQNSLRHTFRGYAAWADHPTGDKFVRMDPAAAAVEHGQMAVLNCPWTKEFLDELEDCGPGAAFVDQADALAGAFNRMDSMKTAGVWGKKK